MFLSKKSKIQYFNEIEKKLELLIKKRNEFTNKVILSNTTTNMLVWSDKSSIHQDFFDQVISVCDFVIKLKIKEPNIVLINGIRKIHEGNLIQYWYDILAKEYAKLSKSKISLFKKEDYYIVEKFYNNYCK
jgi:hypothetical protein